MHTLARDLEYAARTLLKNPAFAVLAILTIALGIGASTAIFSVVNAVLLRPLPYADPDRLVLVWADLRNRDALDFLSPPGDLYDLRQQTTAFEELAAISVGRQPLTGDGPPEQIDVAGATVNLLRTLGVRVALGRDFIDTDGELPAPDTPLEQLPAQSVILTDAFWHSRFGADPGVIGRRIELNGFPGVVVGVLGPEFELLFPTSTNVERVPEMLFALRLDYQNSSRINVFLHMVGRLRPGVSPATAQAQVDAVAADLRERFPVKQTAGLHFRVESMAEDLVVDVRPALLALMGAVGFVLLIACANVANLLLVRTSARERELAVRAALGGSRSRLVRQMLTESVLLAFAGAIIGLVAARLGIRLLLAVRPDNLPRIESVHIDPAVLAFTTLAAFASALVFGVVPALRASRVDVAETLRESGRTGGLSGAGRRLRNSVVIAEVALSFVLLIGCGLMFRSFVALQKEDPGYDAAGVLTFFVNPVQARWGGLERRALFVRELRSRLSAIPGVTAVAAANPVPLDGTPNVGARWGREDALADAGRFQQADLRWVHPGYFEALRTPLVAGRTFTEEDNRPDAALVVIDERFAEKAFPNESPVGKRFLARVRTDEPEWFEVIGVVHHQRHVSLAADSRETMFMTDAVGGFARANRWIVRTDGSPERLIPAVRAAVANLDPLQPIADVQPMSVLVDRAAAPTRFALVLIGVFAGIAALLAAIGLYGVLATMVRQRTPEIGVRMAFGARRTSIVQLVLGEGLVLSAAGLGIGLFAAFALTRVMRSMLVGVAPTDPLTFAAMAVLFVVVATAACAGPALRAARLQPTAALREE
jgi:putative ABC transport system permease protein